jgi:urease subunit alpha
MGSVVGATSLTFTSRAAVDAKVGEKQGLRKDFVAVRNTRDGISKKSMIHNDATPDIEIDAETYEVRADGELLVCEPAKELPMAQRYFMY